MSRRRETMPSSATEGFRGLSPSLRGGESGLRSEQQQEDEGGGDGGFSSLSSHDSGSHSHSSRAVSTQLRDPKESVRHQLALNSTFYREKGNKAYKKRNYDVAHALYTKGIRHLPTSKLFCNRSMVNLRRGRPQDAFLDASLAMKLQPRNVKAYVRRAAALQKLGKLKEAAEDLEKACELGTDEFVMKMLEDVKLCLSCVEGTAAGKKERNKNASILGANDDAAKTIPKAGTGDLDQGKMQAMENALEVLQLSIANDDDENSDQFVDSSKVSLALSRLQSLLESGSESLDFFFACSGVSKVFDAFRYDNLKVLNIIRQLCAASPPDTLEARTRARAHKIMFLNDSCLGHFEIILECVMRKRVAVVSAALDIMDVFLDKKEFREHLLEAKPAENSVRVILTMFGKASEALSAKSAHVIAKIAHLKKFVAFAVEQNQELVKGLWRCCMSADDTSKAAGLSIYQKVGHSKAILSMLSGKETAAGISNMLVEAISSRVQGEQIFVSAAFTMDQLDQLADILNVCVSLCIPRRSSNRQSVSKEFVTELSDKGMWAIVIRMIESHSFNLRIAAITLFVSACKCLPELSFAVARDKDAFQIFFDIFTNSSNPKLQEEVSYIANVLCNVPEFHQLLSTRYPLGDLLKIAQINTPDMAIVALCRILLCVSRNDEDFRDKLCDDVELLKILVQLWYGRQATAKVYVLQLLQHLLSEEKASKLLTESASEGQIMGLIQDLAKHKVMMEAYETGGASLFSPPFENDMPVIEKSRLLDHLDISKLCTYLSTLSMPGEDNVVVELCSASGTMLGNRLLCTQLAHFMPTSFVYAVDWAWSLADRVENLASQANARNVYSKLCDYETVDQLPVSGNVYIIAGIWESLEDPPQLFESIKSKLCAGGKIVLIERLLDCLEDAIHWAQKSGFEVFAEPKLNSGCHVSVMQVQSYQVQD